jgi:hypothetical protein
MPVTREDQGLTAWLSADSQEDLRRAFVASPEFRKEALQLPPLSLSNANAERVPRLLALNNVEWRVDPAGEARLVEYIQQTWNVSAQPPLEPALMDC